MFQNNESSSDDDESLCKQALPIADDSIGPIDLSKMPTTGEEYLRQVRYDDKYFFLFYTNCMIKLMNNFIPVLSQVIYQFVR